MARTTATKEVQAAVLLKSKRRCALCFGLKNDLSERLGQIAHVNGDHADTRIENLVWLCLEHHDKYDSRTSQTKNYTPLEVKRYRNDLYKNFEPSKYIDEDIELTRKYLRELAPLFRTLITEYDGLADRIDCDTLQELANIRDYWESHALRSFNKRIRQLQDEIARAIRDIRSIYKINMYDGISSFIKFDNKNFGREILHENRSLIRKHIDEIISYRKELEEIALDNNRK